MRVWVVLTEGVGLGSGVSDHAENGLTVFVQLQQALLLLLQTENCMRVIRQLHMCLSG